MSRPRRHVNLGSQNVAVVGDRFRKLALTPFCSGHSYALVLFLQFSKREESWMENPWCVNVRACEASKPAGKPRLLESKGKACLSWAAA